MCQDRSVYGGKIIISFIYQTLIKAFIVSLINEDYIDLIATDVGGDDVDITDATNIRRYLASLKIPCPVGELFNRTTGDPVETLEETVIADTSGVKVTVKSLGREYYPYLTLNPIGFFVEANPGDTVQVTFEICERAEKYSDEKVLYTADAFTFTL